MSKVALFKDGVFVRITNNPRKDLDLTKITGLEEGYSYHKIKIKPKPSFDSRYNSITKDKAILIDDVYTYSYSILDKELEHVLIGLESNLHNYIDSRLPESEQLSQLSRNSELLDKKINDELTAEETTELAELQEIQEWLRRVHEDYKTRKETSLETRVNPLFDSWEVMPGYEEEEVVLE